MTEHDYYHSICGGRKSKAKQKMNQKTTAREEKMEWHQNHHHRHYRWLWREYLLIFCYVFLCWVDSFVHIGHAWRYKTYEIRVQKNKIVLTGFTPTGPEQKNDDLKKYTTPKKQVNKNATACALLKWLLHHTIWWHNSSAHTTIAIKEENRNDTKEIHAFSLVSCEGNVKTNERFKVDSQKRLFLCEMQCDYKKRGEWDQMKSISSFLRAHRRSLSIYYFLVFGRPWCVFLSLTSQFGIILDGFAKEHFQVTHFLLSFFPFVFTLAVTIFNVSFGFGKRSECQNAIVWSKCNRLNGDIAIIKIPSFSYYCFPHCCWHWKNVLCMWHNRATIHSS